MLVEHNEERIQKKKTAVEKRRKKAAEQADRVAGVILIFDRTEIIKLKGKKLKDHLLAYQKAGAPNLQGITVRSPVAQIREALQAAADRKNAGKWTPIMHSEPEDSVEEESEEEVSDEEE